jgi:hypothetical protein
MSNPRQAQCTQPDSSSIPTKVGISVNGGYESSYSVTDNNEKG